MKYTNTSSRKNVSDSRQLRAREDWALMRYSLKPREEWANRMICDLINGLHVFSFLPCSQHGNSAQKDLGSSRVLITTAKDAPCCQGPGKNCVDLAAPPPLFSPSPTLRFSAPQAKQAVKMGRQPHRPPGGRRTRSWGTTAPASPHCPTPLPGTPSTR